MSTLTVPSAPPYVSVGPTTGDSYPTVTWAAPINNGGSDITGYTIYSNPPGLSASLVAGPTATSIVYTGLTYGKTYTFTVKATNAQGDSLMSSRSAPFMVTTVPSAPRNLVAKRPYAGSVLLSWNPLRGNDPITSQPLNGASRLLQYVVTCSDANVTVPTGSLDTSMLISGILNASPLTFSVYSKNANGQSTVPLTITVNPIVAPSKMDPPTVTAIIEPAAYNLKSTVDSASINVSWNAPIANNSNITGYTVTCTPTVGSRVIKRSVGYSRILPLVPVQYNSIPTSVVVQKLTYGETYNITVSANTNNVIDMPIHDVILVSPDSDPTVFTPLTTPNPVTNLNVSNIPTTDNLIFTWVPPMFNGGAPITSYDIYYKTTPSANVTQLLNITTPMVSIPRAGLIAAGAGQPVSAGGSPTRICVDTMKIIPKNSSTIVVDPLTNWLKGPIKPMKASGQNYYSKIIPDAPTNFRIVRNTKKGVDPDFKRNIVVGWNRSVTNGSTIINYQVVCTSVTPNINIFRQGPNVGFFGLPDSPHTFEITAISDVGVSPVASI